jgi:hypothetical protein
LALAHVPLDVGAATSVREDGSLSLANLALPIVVVIIGAGRRLLLNAITVAQNPE